MSDRPGHRPPPTPEQLRALAVSGASVALSAGAGTGKTTVLAERFVRALEGSEAMSLSKVVALTFTNKAARELRERIRRECRERLESAENPGRWKGILRGLEAARIGTFHSFCGDVLRRHSIEAGVDPGFAVLDETIAFSIRQESLDLSLREALTRRDPDLIELAVEYGLGLIRQAIDNLLGNRSSGDLRDWVDRSPRDLVDRWRELWEAEIQPALLDRFRASLRPCLELIDQNTFDHPKIQQRLEEFKDAVTLLEVRGDPVPALNRIAEVAKVQGLVAKNWPSKDVYDAIGDHFKKIRDDSKKLEKTLPWDEPTSMRAADQGLKLARLTLKAREVYDRAKRERGGLDNDDLLVIVRDLLARPGSSARVALEASIDLVLVDEFQDTDPVQAEILESLAGVELLGGKLFLVGDFKQSIYRFRGARPELFQSYRDRFPDEGRLELSANFRSIPAILGFVNALFADTFSERNAALRPGLTTIEDLGEPAIAFLWGREPSEQPTAKRDDAGSLRRQEARRIARYLKARLDQGWTILDTKSGVARLVNAGDIAFLFRSLSDASEYEQALVAEGLDYHVVGGSGYFAQQEVLDLINVLTAIEDPLDAVALAGALRSPFFSISDDALFWISTEHFGQLYQGLESCAGDWLDRLPEDDRPRAVRARRLLAEWRVMKDRLPIAGVVDRILSDSGYEAALVGEFLGDRKRANARKLVQMARRFDEQGGFTLADFVGRLRADLRAATRETQAATTDEAGEIIRLMSIHQSKGLEFPVVVIPDLDRKRPGNWDRVAFDAELGPLVNPVVEAAPGDETESDDPGGCLGWTIYCQRERQAEEAEALRLFYVATTRARNVLVISSATPASKRPSSPSMTLLDTRFDRATGRFVGVLPEGWPEPKVIVVEPEVAGSGGSATVWARPRPRLLEVARTIEDGIRQPVAAPPRAIQRPRTFDLDPSFGLSSTSARLDRLIRTMLADPRTLDPKLIEELAWRASSVQNPVSPRGLVEQAIERMEGWSRSLSTRKILPEDVVRRAFDWAVSWPEFGASTLFRGRGDLLYRRNDRGLELVLIADPSASEARERLRVLLSAVAADRLGLGQVQRAWWVRLGKKDGTVVFKDFDKATIDRAVDAVFTTDRPTLTLSGP